MIQKKRVSKNLKKNNTRSKKNKLLIGRGKIYDEINIIVKTIDDLAEYTVKLNSNDDVAVLKNNIDDTLGINPKYQRLTFLGNELQNSQTLSRSGLINGSTVIVEDIYENQILTIQLVFVVDQDKPGNRFIVRIPKNKTVLELKELASPMFKISVRDMQLSLDMLDRFDDEQILSDLGLVTNESVVYVDDDS